MEYWRLLAHNHWYSIDLFGHRLRLCARCSGYVLGFISALLVSGLLGFNPLTFLDLKLQVIASILLLAPLAADWLTQSWGIRVSNNRIRVTTGILMGLDLYLLHTLEGDKLNWGLTILLTASGLTALGIIGKIATGSVKD